MKDVNFTVPYDCNFFIVHRLHLSSFKVSKIYNQGTNLIFRDYGILYGMNRDHDLAIIPRFADRINANQTEYTVVSNDDCIEVLSVL